ncbi:MAG: hypothetical protein ACI9TH_003098 [Kiritimatiellia bacterium]|jgi:hypothetical protein
MKKVLPTLILLFAVQLVSRAEEPTLLHEKDYWNVYFQPEIVFTELNSDSAEFAGAEIGASLNEHFDIGFTAHTLLNDVTLKVPGVPNPHEGEIWYMGVSLRKHFQPCKLVDASFRFFIGGGRIEVGNKTDGTDADTDFMLFEPSFELGVNITDRFVLGTRLGYRLADGSDSRLIEDKEFSNVSGAIFLRFDEF